MLPTPAPGIRAFIGQGGQNFDPLSDWIEGSVTFTDDEISQSDVVDALVEDHVIADSDSAMPAIDEAWAELRRRARLAAGIRTFDAREKRLVRRSAWTESPENAFCILLSLSRLVQFRSYRDGAVTYAAQGDLFERIAYESLQTWGWTAKRALWQGPDAPSREGRLMVIADAIGERLGRDREEYLSPHANDTGLDLFWSRAFSDGRGGRLNLLVQCASGSTDWESKLQTPNLGVWSKLLDFHHCPSRAFAVPFVFTEGGLRRISNSYQGVILDRFRLLRPEDSTDVTFSEDLNNDLRRWLDPLVNELIAMLT